MFVGQVVPTVWRGRTPPTLNCEEYDPRDWPVLWLGLYLAIVWYSSMAQTFPTDGAPELTPLMRVARDYLQAHWIVNRA